ncbi:myosin 1 [Saccharomycopsis crataegensis]|uniref:Myosin 1 n=1 Tax=Saccharomycopsis crataegensis TaxID=43959 RepID=A0AAV5QQW7_9ASCO|nr:myosin 1 [Saccharomycopsis crataegensis]
MSSNDEEIEFNSHKWVWIPDKSKTFVKGFVLEDNLDSGTKMKIRTEDDKDIIVMKDEVEPVNPPRFNSADDMAELTHLNEPSVLYNLQQRYMNDLIYTYSGLFLVAVNPYANVPLYGPDYVDMYNGSNKNDSKPHIFAITELTYRYMLEKQQHQSILVTGESGAGKTENTKKIIQYLAAITSSMKTNVNSSGGDTVVVENFEDQIIQANPILESFGNAQTVRNNNSSRFGKFIRIEFSGKGKISGANIDWYLLEKSRVIHQASNERNYHIFYQLLLGLTKSEKENLYINEHANFFNYLKNGNITIPNVDDKKEFRDLIHAFEVMNFSKEEYWEIFKTAAIILLIGNINFISRSTDKARFSDDSPLTQLCDLLGIDLAAFKQAILTPKVKAGKEFVTQNKTASQAKFSLDSISKSLYERTFKYIVDKINDKLDHSLSTSHFIGVLDIAGFEIFKQNSFEQLCINYTNEKLQQFFNHHMFVLEQNEYIKENINWEFIDFGQDLQDTIDLIESNQNPIGILSVLNEECIVPKSSDKSFINKLNTIWASSISSRHGSSSSKFKKSRYDNGFTVKHYAGEVDYTTDGWLDKNRDPLNQNAVDLLIKASNKHIALLFADEEGLDASGTTNAKKQGAGKGGMFRTVAQRHKEQLSDLMTQLSNTYPHFVRCILPNNKKKPHDLDKKLVLDQLRCNGVLEGIRIARAGYPNRIFFKEFYQRYKFLAKQLQAFGSSNDFKKNCEIILNAIDLEESVYKVGLTKIFFKNGILAQLEIKREEIIKDIFVGFQSLIRGKLIRGRIQKELQKVQAAQVIMKNFMIFNELKNNEWYNLMIKIKPLLDSSKQQKQKQLAMDQVNKYKDQIVVLEEQNKATISEKEELSHELKKLNEVLMTERDLLSEKENKLQETKKKEIELSQSLQANLGDSAKLKSEIEELVAAKEALDKKAQTLESDLANKTKRLDEIESQKKSLSDEKGRLQKELNKATSSIEQYKKDSSAQIELKIKSATTSLNLEVKKLTSENNDLKEQLVKLKESSTKLELARSTKTRDLDNLNKTIETQKEQIKSLTSDKAKISADHDALLKEHAKVKEEAVATQAKFKKLESDALEAKNLLKIKIADDIKFERGKQKFDNEILELKHAKKLMEKELAESKQQNAELMEKLANHSGNDEGKSTARGLSNENDNSGVNLLAMSGDDKLVNDYNSMKLQLNEKSAMLNHETQQRKKLEAELKIFQTRLASESFDNQKLNAQLRKLKRNSRIGYIQETSFNNDFLNGSSSNSSEHDIEEEELLMKKNTMLQKEIDHLKLELAKRSENGMDLLPKKMKSVKGASSGNGHLISKFNNLDNQDDSRSIYKIKFENADAKVKSLEKQLRDLNYGGPLRENMNIQNANYDVDSQELMKKLKMVKQENSRLQRILNDMKMSNDHDRSFDDGETSKEFILQEELVTSRLRLESSQGKVDELTRQVNLFKERSEEYFNKLEIAEHAVRSSKRGETKAKQELQEVAAALSNLKQGERSSETQVAKMKLKINQMEAKVQSKEGEIRRLRATQQTLTEELEHYRFKLVTDSKSEKDRKFDELNKRLKEKLILETNLKKDLQVARMLLENTAAEKEAQEEELAAWRKDQSKVTDRLTTLEADNARYRSLDKGNKKKLDSLLQQINTLHEAMDKMISERELIQRDKRILEDKIEELSNGHDTNDAMNSVLHQQKQEIERSRKELELHYRAQKVLKKELMDEKENTLMVIEENKGLGNLIKELQGSIKEFEHSKKTDGGDHEFYLRRIQELEGEVNDYQQHEENFLIMERLIKDLKIKLENVEKENDDLMKENQDVLSKSDQLKEMIDQLEESESQATLNYRRVERALKDQKEAKMRSEMDLINWKNKLSKFANRK